MQSFARDRRKNEETKQKFGETFPECPSHPFLSLPSSELQVRYQKVSFSLSSLSSSLARSLGFLATTGNVPWP